MIFDVSLSDFLCAKRLFFSFVFCESLKLATSKSFKKVRAMSRLRPYSPPNAALVAIGEPVSIVPRDSFRGEAENTQFLNGAWRITQIRHFVLYPFESEVASTINALWAAWAGQLNRGCRMSRYQKAFSN